MNKYDKFSKEDLIKVVEKLESRKKYGLIWDEEKVKEQFEKDAENALPVLKEIKGKEIKDKNDKPVNILIEGDNYHALSVLNFTHQEKINAIYIDPPYNTGAKDWKYNNDYIDSTDSYRHSKWISFMDKRLRLAKNLLTEEGIICVTIDDYEIPRLLLLMEEIFGEFNHLGTIAIRNNPAGRSTTKGVSITHEYAIFFGKSDISQVFRLERSQIQKDRYDQKDNKGSFEWVNFRKPGSMRAESPSMFYPVFITTDSVRIPNMKWDSIKEEWIALEKPQKNEKILYPVDDNGEERRWRYGVERARAEIDEFKPKIQKGKLHAYVKGRLNDEGILPMTWWDKKEYSSTAYGTNLLKDMFSELQAFSYPKSIFAVMDCLKVMSDKKDAIILDFFAGSGTTGHAVLELNKQDGGSRQFILCTNNEKNIATEVCYPRIEKVIQGYKNQKGKKVEGLGGSLKYLKTKFVKNASSKDDFKIRITKECTEMLCLREGIFDEIKKTNDYRIFQQGDKTLAVYYSLEHKTLSELKKELNKIDGEKIFYCFTLDPLGLDKSDFRGWNNVSLESIPQKILDVYKQIYEY
ncbi:MAG TPA: site-specific DNA-methyltransferase [Candidatus Paceibacterota bacterium]|nr:site-specific DNA-methyltransferase [Candidatus Paceibacterota bacterium]